MHLFEQIEARRNSHLLVYSNEYAHGFICFVVAILVIGIALTWSICQYFTGSICLQCGNRVIVEWACCQIRKIVGCMHQEYRTFSPPTRVSDPDMHQGTCVTHVPWCMHGSLTNGFLWNRWRGKRSRHSRRMRNQWFYICGKRLIASGAFEDMGKFNNQATTTKLYKLRSVQNTGTCHPGQGWFVRNLGWGR